MIRVIGSILLLAFLIYAASNGEHSPFKNSSLIGRPTEAQKIIPKQEKKNSTQDAKGDRETQSAVLIARALKNAMHNPASFELMDMLKMSDGTYCITYRARNGFNALMVSRAAVTSKKSLTSDEPDFVPFWNRHCGGKTGTNLNYVKALL